MTAMRMSKKPIRFIRKTTTLHTTIFWYISLPFLCNYKVKMLNYAFYGERKQATTKSYFCLRAWIWFLRNQLQFGSPTVDKVPVEMFLHSVSDWL